MNNLVLVNTKKSIDLGYVPMDLEECDPRTRGKFNHGASIRKEVLAP